MICNYSSIDEVTLKEINDMEQALGVKLLAFSCHDPSIANLDTEQLDKLKMLEDKIGARLVAIQ